METLLAHTINVAVNLQLIKHQELGRVIVDSTVQHKAIAHPTDSRLLQTARMKLVEAAQEVGIHLKQTFAKQGKDLSRKAVRYPYEFGVKVGIASTLKGNLIVGERAFHGDPYDGHLKTGHRMDRYHLQGITGDRIHAVLCAAGYNLRWLLLMIARKGIAFLAAYFFLLKQAGSQGKFWLAAVVYRV